MSNLLQFIEIEPEVVFTTKSSYKLLLTYEIIVKSIRTAVSVLETVAIYWVIDVPKYFKLGSIYY